jgi:hypothetical protein
MGGERVLPIGLIKPGWLSPGYPPPDPSGASEVFAYSDPQPKGPQLLPGGGQKTLTDVLKGSENSEKRAGDIGVAVGAMEDRWVDALPERMDGDGNGLFQSEAHIKRSSSDSASSSWSFLHRSYNGQAISSSSSAPVGSVGESVTQAFGQMHYTDDSNSEATESAPAEIVDLTVGNGKEGGRFEKSGNPRKERRKIPIVDSSDGDSRSELGSRAAMAWREGSTRKKKKSKRKEKVPSDEGMASGSGGEQPAVQRRRHKKGKRGKGKEIAHSDGSMEFQSDQDRPGPSNPRKESRQKKISKQVESPSGYESPTSSKIKKKKKKKKRKAEEAEEVQEGTDVDMDASDPPRRLTRKRRGGRQLSVSESEDAIQPLIEGISETHVARGPSTSRLKSPADTSSSDPKTKKRKRNRTSSLSPILDPIPPPPPADLSSSPARPGESIDMACRRHDIEGEIHRINLQQHELSVRELDLRHELVKLRYQARVEAGAQGSTYANCMCSACGEYGHKKNNRAKCKKHEKYKDWYPER